MSSKRLIYLLLILVLVAAGAWFYITNYGNLAKTTNITPTADTNETETTKVPELSATAAAQTTCGYTPEATSGPYYISGTMALSNSKLNYDDLPGTPIRVGGYVYGAEDNSTPVANAKIEIWQADNTGMYHPQAQGEASSYSEDKISLRGYVTTDSKGYYEFTSILPAEYEGRTRHIHVKITADAYQTLTSQMIAYQPGDKVTPDSDTVATDFPDCSVLSFTENDGIKTATFNFHIQKQ